jgi:hexosaminidase
MKFSYRTSPTPLLLLAVLSSFFVLQSNFSHGVDLAIASEPLKSDTNVSLIPQPQNISLKEGAKLKLPPLITYSAPDKNDWQNHLAIVNTHVIRATGGKHRLQPAHDDNTTLTITGNESLTAEAYSLDVTERRINISVSSIKGLTRATSTLLQLIGNAQTNELPQLAIRDQPRLSYRNFMIDIRYPGHAADGSFDIGG